MKKDSPDNSPKNAFASVKLTNAPAPKKLDSPFINSTTAPEPIKAPVVQNKPIIAP